MAVSVYKNLNIGWPAGSRIPPPSHKASSEKPLGSGPLSWGRPPDQMQGCWRPPPRRSGGRSSHPPADVNPGPGTALQSLLLTGARLHWWQLPQLVVPSTSSHARQRERVKHIEQQTPEFAAETDLLQDHAGGAVAHAPRPRAPRRGSAEYQRPGEGGAGLNVADCLVSESLALAAVHIREVPVSLQTSHMPDDTSCHEWSLLSLCEWKCYPFKVGALRMGSASGSAQRS